ncbi:MAG TPA: SCO family protein [Caulobacteraceae bacterium]|jgi:protein SCO1/2|nr:SCO family protein [Caulobacteraceae bacterium]
MRRIVIYAAAALAAIVLGFTLYQFQAHAPQQTAQSGIQMGGPFHLVDQNGQVVTDKDLLGKPTVMFFGFTYCPDVCPTTLADMSAWLKALGPDADKLNVVYVTIDPERDTAQRLKSYLTAFDPRIRGLTGTPQAIAEAAHDYNVYYQKVALQGGEYTMDHSTLIYLMDAKGHMAELIQYGTPRDQVVASLRKLVHSA